MDDLFFARSLMALSLGFHIIFAVIGIGMPALMAVSEGLWLKTRDEVYLTLTRRWARGTAVLFAVGAVSGTVLSFELGLLWPHFMTHAGGVIGMPFSLEGFAFFTEAIFLGIHLYGWNRTPPWAHWLSGVMVAVSGMLSGVFVVTANAWMNAPAGFDVVDGRIVNVDPVAAMLNPASLQQVVHMTLAAYVATGFAAAAVHAFFLLREPTDRFHRRALGIALGMAIVATPLQVLSGDFSAKWVARWQPVKFAAMEGHYRTEAAADLIVGGIPDDDAMETRWALRVPGLLSFMAHGDLSAEVTGLEEFPRDEWPNVRIVHWAFDLMVGCGTALLLLAAWAGWRWIRTGKLSEHRRLLRALVLAGPVGFVAIEAGWVVTEVGRQPWVIQGFLKTADAVTEVRGLAVPFVLFAVLYVFLAAVTVALLRRQFVGSYRDEAAEKADGA